MPKNLDIKFFFCPFGSSNDGDGLISSEDDEASENSGEALDGRIVFIWLFVSVGGRGCTVSGNTV